MEIIIILTVIMKGVKLDKENQYEDETNHWKQLKKVR